MPKTARFDADVFNRWVARVAVHQKLSQSPLSEDGALATLLTDDAALAAAGARGALARWAVGAVGLAGVAAATGLASFCMILMPLALVVVGFGAICLSLFSGAGA